MSVPPDQMMAQQGPPPGPPGPGAPGAMAPNLLPFASTQPGGVMQLLAPLLAQQQQDEASLKQQQLEAVMGVLMKAMQEEPNDAAMAAQTEPSAPMDGTAPPGVMDAGMSGGAPDATNYPGAA